MKLKLRLLVNIIIPVLFLNTTSGEDTLKKHFPFYTGKGSEVLLDTNLSDAGNIFMYSDTVSKPLFYYQKVFTVVCLSEVCKPADLVLFWDASGSFLGFEIPETSPLTKTDHAEFTDYDYYLLYSILNNPYSILVKLSYDELVSKPAYAANGLDAQSGATIITNKNSIVSGAAFTCHTLWHLINNVKLNREILNLSAANFDNIEILKPNYKDLFKDISGIHPGKLALILSAADKEKKLKKYAIQNMLTENMYELSPLQVLIINNYIRRQVFVFPEIEERLANCKANDESFFRMLGADY